MSVNAASSKTTRSEWWRTGEVQRLALEHYKNTGNKLLTFQLKDRPSNDKTTLPSTIHAHLKICVNVEDPYSIITTNITETSSMLAYCILKCKRDLDVERYGLLSVYVLLCSCMFITAGCLRRVRWGIGVQSRGWLAGHGWENRLRRGRNSSLANTLVWPTRSLDLRRHVECVFTRLSYWL